MAKIVIFGGGMTGLVSARELARAGHEVHVFEATDRVGGLAKTYKDPDGFIYDNGPRFIFSTLAEKIGIAELCEPVKYYENLWIKGKYYLFPFGLIKNPRYAFSAGLATLTRQFHKAPKNLAEFLRVYYGRLFSGEVLRPLIEKWAGISAEKVSIDFASRLLPTNIGYIIHSLIKKIRGGVTEDYFKKGRYIVYPRTSNAAIFEKLASEPGVRVHTNSKLVKIETKDKIIQKAVINGTPIYADLFISTIPISKLAALIDHPGEAEKWKQFKYRGILLLFIKINRPHVLKTLWTWFPETKYRFYRISEFKNAREDLAPKDKTMICMELACETHDPLWSETKEKIFQKIQGDLEALYHLKKEEVLGTELKKSEHAYPVMKTETENMQRSLEHQTPFQNLFIAGRTGMFQYRMLEGCFESAETCVKTILKTLEGGIVDEVQPVKRDPFGRPMVVPE